MFETLDKSLMLGFHIYKVEPASPTSSSWGNDQIKAIWGTELGRQY
jgi:hypothetical protein